MSEGPQPVHPETQKLNEAWQDGYYGRYADTYRLRDAASQQAYERGRRAREAGRVDSGGAPDQKQTLGEAVFVAFGLAGAAAGFLYGLRRVGDGEGGWPGAFGLLVAGLVAGLMVWALLAAVVRRGHKAFIWKRGREERDAATLARMWEARFSREMPGALLTEISDDGRGWTMDGKANFHLRMRSGKEFFVGLDAESGALVTSASGRTGSPLEDAYQFVLIHQALGHESIRVDEGSKKHRRALWAAASFVGLEVADYTPDAKAVRMLADMKEQFASRGAGGPGQAPQSG